MIQNTECEMSPRLTTPFPVNCEHFLVMMDVFILWQMTLTTDGDCTFTLFSPFFLSQANNTEQLTEIHSEFQRWGHPCKMQDKRCQS